MLDTKRGEVRSNLIYVLKFGAILKEGKFSLDFMEWEGLWKANTEGLFWYQESPGIRKEQDLFGASEWSNFPMYMAHGGFSINIHSIKNRVNDWANDCIRVFLVQTWGDEGAIKGRLMKNKHVEPQHQAACFDTNPSAHFSPAYILHL